MRNYKKAGYLIVNSQCNEFKQRANLFIPQNTHRLVPTVGCKLRNHPVEVRVSLTVTWTQWFVAHDAKTVSSRFFFFLCNTLNIRLRSLLRHFLKKRGFPFAVCPLHTHTFTHDRLHSNRFKLEIEELGSNDIHRCLVNDVRLLIEEILTAWHQNIKSFIENIFSSH